MKAVKIIFGIFLCLTLPMSLYSFFTGTINEGVPEVIGHLIAIAIIVFLIYRCFKPSKKNHIKKENTFELPKNEKKIKDYVNLGHSINIVILKLSEIFEKHKAGDSHDLKEGIYLVAYAARKGIVDRIDKYDWNMEGPILIPAISPNNITLDTAYANSVLLIKDLSRELNLELEVEGILEKQNFYYEFESMLPKEVINQIDKLVLINT
jgi:hypothetical protein